MRCLAALGLLGCAGVHAAHPIPHFDKFEPHRQAVLERTLGEAYRRPATVAAGTSVFDPRAYGGDATGATDSTQAVQAAIDAMTTATNITRGGFVDLGGAALDFNGGIYTVRKPIVFPSGYANFFIQGGTLRAAIGFDGPVLLRVGALEGVAKGDAVHNVRIQSMTLDGQNVVDTTLAVYNGQYADIGPAVMVYGFEAAGIKLDGTGGGYIHHSWLGQYAPELKRDTPTATAVVLQSPQHDAYVETVIIWSAKIGILSHTGANQISGVHAWNLSGAKGGACMLFQGYEGGKGKVIDSYLDFCPIVVEDPTSIIISNNLFLATANVVLRAASLHTIKGLEVTNNRFDSEGGKYGNNTIVLDGKFTGLHNAVIEGNIADASYPHRGTRATLSADAEGKSATIDFTDVLLFSLPIQEVTCSLQSSVPAAHSWTLQGHTQVTVHFSEALPAGSRVTCTVEQSRRYQAAH